MYQDTKEALARISAEAEAIERQYGYNCLKYCFDPRWIALANASLELERVPGAYRN
jgi:hypothetical protein